MTTKWINIWETFNKIIFTTTRIIIVALLSRALEKAAIFLRMATLQIPTTSKVSGSKQKHQQ